MTDFGSFARMVQAVVRSGDLSRRVEVPDDDALAPVAASVNQLLDRLESALRTTHEKVLPLAVDQAPVGMALLDLEGRFLDVNPACCGVLGFERGEMIGRHFAEFGPDPQGDAEREKIRELGSGTVERAVFDKRCSAKDGSEVIGLVTLALVRDAGGHPDHLIAAFDDITAIDAAYRALLESEERFRDLYDNAPDMYLSVGRDRRILDCNRTALKTLGYARDELLGRDVIDLYHPECHANVVRGFEEFLQSGSVVDAELRVVRKDGTTLDVSLSATAVLDEDGRPLRTRSIWRDVSRRRETERRLLASRDELRHLALRLERVREEERAAMSREIHDEFGQALTAIKMDIHWLKPRLDGHPDASPRIRQMLELVDRTAEQVQEFSTRLHPPVLDEMGLAEAIRWHAREFARRADLEAHVVIAADGLDAVDPTVGAALYRVFQEALTNVARHAGATTVRVELRVEDGGLRLRVSDDGVGTAPAAAPARTGGIAGMRERVRLLGGRFGIEGEVGRGSDIDVWVPRVPSAVYEEDVH